ncbi:ATPase component of general energizing module of ECF transporter [Lachnospiraceae bacterium TWA4]|nr:ATPase component of general energizing module of ECF transporter [Lachnospiraceae bacterium TWA4]
MGIIKMVDILHEYFRKGENNEVIESTRAIDHVNIDVNEGEFVAILGHNGSGKSTLAKHINGLLFPQEGTVWIEGKDSKNEENLLSIRQTIGMVFQNPDNQIVGSIVEEDVGFGPENIGVETKEIWNRVSKSLERVGMVAYHSQSPNHLSGGQKQRVAIAGVLAMRPKCIVLDESTAMLDPGGRKEVINTVLELNKKEKITVILITHYMEEAIEANRVIVMDGGKVVMQGLPREIFSQVEKLKELRLDVPQMTELSYLLRNEGVNLPSDILTIEEMVEANMSIKLNDICYEYQSGSKTIEALKHINLEIKDNEFVGLIGHTGSGKSTLIQHLNGLLKASSGSIYYNGEDIYGEKYSLRSLRHQVGLVFQYPEYQLFEMDVFTDVCFGPKNQGLDDKEIKERALWALKAVKLDESLYSKSPFELSGGQKRRVAIAGVLAMKPQVLILDEPTAGLDPKGRDDILELLVQLKRTHQMTIILVSHSMEDVAKYVDRLIVLDNGEIFLDGTPKEVFSHYKELEKIGLAAPKVTYLMHELKKRGLDVDITATTLEEAKDTILQALKTRNKRGDNDD